MREKAIRKFVREVLRQWRYPMPPLWFVKNKSSAYRHHPLGIRLRRDAGLKTVLHELTHYRDDEDGLAIGDGSPEMGAVNLSILATEAKDEVITEEVANQLEAQYQSLWDWLLKERNKTGGTK